MKLRGFVAAISMLALMAGCASVPDQVTSTEEPNAVPEQLERSFEPEKTASEDQPPPPADLWERMRREFSLTDIDNPRIDKARRHFLRQHNYMEVVAGRGTPYLHYILEEVEARGMPIEVALLPMVESAFDPFARSSQEASGLWQIMPATGRSLGLERDWWYDGSRDLRASTHAALDYLQHMHQFFDGDWLLALAAYNSGKARVTRAQRANRKRGRGTDFWSLKLPRETRGYVPRLLALAEIVSDPDAFDTTLPPVANEPFFTVVNSGGQIEMRRVAEMAAVPLVDLRGLNAGHRRWATAPDRPHQLLMPVDGVERFEQKLVTLAPEDRVRWHYYRIQRGDSLNRIARNFNTSVELLREANSLRGSLIRAGDQLMIPHGGDWEKSLALADSGQRQERGYSVRRGDSLYDIAGKFNVSISDIVSWNSLDPKKYLQPGQKLTLYVSGG